VKINIETNVCVLDNSLSRGDSLDGALKDIFQREDVLLSAYKFWLDTNSTTSPLFILVAFINQ
jgi:hypothetical protein